MTLKQTLAALTAAGTVQNRKIYARHGAVEPIIGVSYGELGKLVRKIKTDADLALALWETGKHDARILACKIAPTESISVGQLKNWATDAKPNQVLLDELSSLVANTPLAGKLSDVWAKQKAAGARSLAWEVRAELAHNEELLPEAECAEWLAEIEQSLSDEENRVRHSMNNALIAIGVRSPSLTKKALKLAKKIGTVEVDHGDTGCVTPEAAAYIKKTLAHRAKKGAQYSKGSGRA